MPPQKAKTGVWKFNAQSKAKGQTPKKVPLPEPSDEDDDDDIDADLDEDDLGEDMSDINEDVSLDEDSEVGSDDVDEDSDEEVETNVKKKTEKSKLQPKNEKQVNGKKVAKVEVAVEGKKSAANESGDSVKLDHKQLLTENRKSAMGPLSEAEAKMFSANFRAMSSTSVFVGKLPADATDEDLQKLHPSIQTVRRPTTRKGKPTTFAFLNFADVTTAQKALAELRKRDSVKIRGQDVVVSENGTGQCHPPGLVDRRKLRIYGCPKDVTKEEIQKALPDSVDVFLGDRDKGNVLFAFAVFPSSVESKRVLEAHPTITLKGAACALFYLNVSHTAKQQERKKERKAALKRGIKSAGASTNNAEEEQSNMPLAKKQKLEVKENVKLNSSASAAKAKKQVFSAKISEPEDELEDDDDDADVDDDDDDESGDDADEPPVKPAAKQFRPSMKAKKVSMKTPQTTPRSQEMGSKKSPRKGTPFKKHMKKSPHGKKMKA